METGLRISAIQFDITWENPQANFGALEKLITPLIKATDVVVLPEMFTTGFSMNTAEIADDHLQSAALSWMKIWAEKINAVITGSVSTKDGNDYFNRLYWVRPDGTFSFYNKRHTFTFAQENLSYRNGQNRIIEEWRGFKICPLICYDLRFPVWSRNTIQDGSPVYDVLIYVANWPSVRRDPWMKLLQARAIENQAYVIGVNRTGTDGTGLPYSGDSLIVDPRGNIMNELQEPQPITIKAVLSRTALDDFRSKFPALNDADDFRIL